MRALALAVVLSCTPRHDAPSTAGPRARIPEAGISIALYDRDEVHGGGAYGVVDDRRWVELAADELVLDNIDPGADLASLVIEPLGDAAIRVGACTRSRLPTLASATPEPLAAEGAPTLALRHAELARRLQLRHGVRDTPSAPASKAAPTTDRFDVTVRCAVDGRPGRYLLRVLYVAPSLRYRAQHDIDLASADRATITTRFAIATPSWHVRAELALFDGIPGGDQPPREVARGTAVLDGSIAIVTVPPREVAARLRRVYDGAVRTPDLPPADPAWNRDSSQTVWVWLELPKVHLASGTARVHVGIPAESVRDIDVARTAMQQDTDRPDAPLRLPLWADDELRGTRQRFGDLGKGAQLAERVQLSVVNLGDAAHEVWVEEHVRPARKRRVEGAWPSKPSSSGDLLRSKLEIKPHRVERVGYTIAYDF